MCVATWAIMVVLDAQGHLLYVWPLTAIPLAIALPKWKDSRERYYQLAAIVLGDFVGLEIARLPLWMALVASIVQTAEVWGAATVLARSITTFEDLKSRANVVRLGATAILVPAIFVCVGAIPGSILTHHSLWATWKAVMPSDALGIVVILPFILFFSTGNYQSLKKLRPHLVSTAPALAIFIGTSLFIFIQNTNPFLFLIFPPLILVVFALGLEGAVLTLPILTVIACIATARGHGPVWLRAESSIEHRIFVLQAFLGMVAAVALPVGALLDEQRKAKKAAAEAQSIYETLIRSSEDMIIMSTIDGSRRFVSPAVTKMLGWAPADFVALKFLDAVHPDDRDLAQTILASLSRGKSNHVFRYRATCSDGTFKWVEGAVTGYRDPETDAFIGYVATVRDISAQKQSEDALIAERASLAHENLVLADLASRDELTRLPNRRAFNLALNREASRHSRSDKPLSLLMIDVDFFKRYNDIYGHPAGDVCLKRLASALFSSVGRSSDLVARLGGEEFSVLLPLTDETGAHKIAQDISKAIGDLEIAHSGSPTGFISVSIGIAVWLPHLVSEPALLIQQADRALYDSKRSGRNRISKYAAVSSPIKTSLSDHRDIAEP